MLLNVVIINLHLEAAGRILDFVYQIWIIEDFTEHYKDHAMRFWWEIHQRSI